MTAVAIRKLEGFLETALQSRQDGNGVVWNGPQRKESMARWLRATSLMPPDNLGEKMPLKEAQLAPWATLVVNGAILTVLQKEPKLPGIFFFFFISIFI